MADPSVIDPLSEYFSNLSRKSGNSTPTGHGLGRGKINLLKILVNNGSRLLVVGSYSLAKYDLIKGRACVGLAIVQS